MVEEAKKAGMIRNLPEKTGRSLEEWIALLDGEGPDDDKAWQRWLKETYGLGHFQARLVVSEARARRG